jgi:peptidyl-prolyl cis-trans isomerase SurA
LKSIGLEKRKPEFGALMKEYEDGVVLYKAEQNEVWNKVVVTDSILKSYFAEHKDKFMFPEKVTIGEIRFDSDTLAAVIYDSLKNGADFGDMAERHNTDEELKSKRGQRGPINSDTDDITREASKLKENSISEPLQLEIGVYAIVKLIAKEVARQKSFEEAGAEVSNAFQDYESKRLEKEWLDRIKQKYLVKQNRDVLQNAFVSPQPIQ